MAIKQGTLAIGTLEPDKEKQAYTCIAPATSAGFSINFCNKAIAPVRLWLAYGTGAAFDAAGNARLLTNFEIPGEESYERTGLAVGVNVSVWMKCTGGSLDYAIMGWEKPTIMGGENP